MYLITMFGNLLIILAVSSDPLLHTPTYFFLSNLSFVDICFTSTTVPKMLLNIQTQSKVITYEGCIVQMYCFLLFIQLDIFLLTVMAYGWFVAICHPLRYTVIMNPILCGLLVLISWVIVVSLFYCTGFGVYLSSATVHNSYSSATASVMYTVVTPMLNPFIYSMRNKDIKRALKKFLWKVSTKGQLVLVLKKCLSHLHYMETANNTQISKFLLLGLSEEPELQILRFGIFLSMYLIAVFGNLLVIVAVSSDFHLHTPIMMAYDCFLAICHPLHYTVIMTPQLCGLLVLISWIVSAMHSCYTA
ncbi:olfactory receptor 7A17-like [Dama dama]|uniref:olfactory receptor 7A17-like n=1 Tax=Dama dama TaxID=30532 RepID=UPI002A35E1D9|nr:olfactory receptor 7A17-like [Dama dama]